MAFRTEEVKSYKTVVICDDCGNEKPLLCTTNHPPSFDWKMNGALSEGYTFKQEGNQFKNYCEGCKRKHNDL